MAGVLSGVPPTGAGDSTTQAHSSSIDAASAGAKLSGMERAQKVEAITMKRPLSGLFRRKSSLSASASARGTESAGVREKGKGETDRTGTESAPVDATTATRGEGKQGGGVRDGVVASQEGDRGRVEACARAASNGKVEGGEDSGGSHSRAHPPSDEQLEQSSALPPPPPPQQQEPHQELPQTARQRHDSLAEDAHTLTHTDAQHTETHSCTDISPQADAADACRESETGSVKGHQHARTSTYGGRGSSPSVDGETTVTGGGTSVAAMRVDRWGFILPVQEEQGGGERDEEARKRKAIAKEQARTKKWLHMMQTPWEVLKAKHAEVLKRRVRKGVPDALRRQIWGLMMGLEGEMRASSDLYRELCDRTDVTDKEIHETIERDIDRTFPRHIMFRDGVEGEGGYHSGQSRLRRVLHAYSRVDPEVGYCQGMGFVTAMLLTYFTEEESFYFLRAIMLSRWPGPIRSLYLPGMPLAQEMMHVGDNLVRRFCPRLWNHMKKEGVHYSMYSTQWFVTMFTNCLPFEVLTRVWDAFLYEGPKVVYRVQLAMLKLHEKELLRRDFEKMMEYFRRLPGSITPDVLDIAFQLRLSHKHVEAAQHEFRKGNPKISVNI